jgi:hypothetical protein
MENLTKKTLALTLILLFIAIILIATTSGLRKQKEQEKEAQTPNTQTTYVILETPDYSNQVHDKYYYSGIYENQEESYYREPCQEEPKITRDYSYSSRKEQKEDFLGSYIAEYKVYVLNKENTGNYFTVTFNFKTQGGFEYSEAITQYLRARERKLFLYKDVQFERTEILSWSYDVEKI